MQKRQFLTAVACATLALSAGSAMAQDKFKIGLILPMTGQQATTGRQIEAAAKLWMAQNGDTVAGRKVQLIVKDDTSLPDVTRRLAQELVVNDKVDVLAGMGVTPSATPGLRRESYWRDATRGFDLARASDEAGLVLAGGSDNWQTVSGTTFVWPVTGAAYISNGGATTLATVTLPAGMANATLVMMGANANTTLQHGTGTDQLNLKSGANETLGAGRIKVFRRRGAHSATWFEQ